MYESMRIDRVPLVTELWRYFMPTQLFLSISIFLVEKH